MPHADPVFIIAEAGVSHNGQWTRALDLCDMAKSCGADAVKFQVYHADTMLHGDRDLLKRCELPDTAHRAVKAHCDEIGIEWMASCFDVQAVVLCAYLGAKRIKVGSGEITNLPMLEHIGKIGKPLILSTGMSDLTDVFKASMAYRDGGGHREGLTLLHCVSNYPTEPEHCNLKAIDVLRRNFFGPVGFSDHTVGHEAAVAAVALGARVIEKHIMLDADCPDVAVSLGPEDFAHYVHAIRATEVMLGSGAKVLQPGEGEMRKRARGRWYREGSAA